MSLIDISDLHKKARISLKKEKLKYMTKFYKNVTIGLN